MSAIIRRVADRDGKKRIQYDWWISPECQVRKLTYKGILRLHECPGPGKKQSAKTG